MIDKFNLTAYISPDRNYLESHGDVTEDTSRLHIYKFICRLDRAVVFYFPHKFSEGRNAKIPFAKIDINPKYFECYGSMFAYIDAIFGSGVGAGEFNVSRLDIASDLQGLSIDVLLAKMRVRNIRTDSMSLYKGTIYMGSNPKIRIYDKVKEIKGHHKYDGVTEYERELLDSGKSCTRFEVQIRNVRKTLQDVVDDPLRFGSYFDRLEFFKLQGNNDSGVLQVLYKHMNRKFRNELEVYRDRELEALLKERYVEGVMYWFNEVKEPF